MMNKFINIVLAAIIGTGVSSISYLVYQIVAQIKSHKKDIPLDTDYECNTEPLPIISGNEIPFAYLTFTKCAGQDSERVEYISKEKTILGRGQKNDILIPDINVSKIHMAISYEQDKIWIMDYHTTNGTYVDGHRISPEEKVIIADNANVRIGNTSFIIRKCK